MWNKLRHLHRLNFDIILLQETKLADRDTNDDLIYRWKQTSDGEAYTEPAASSQCGGVAILLSAYACTALPDREILPSHHDPHRYMVMRATLGNEPIYIHTLYAPVHRDARPTFFNNLPTHHGQGSHLIGGDFNCVMDLQLDTTGDRNIAGAGTVELRNWLSTMNAIDPWRNQHGNKIEMTSPSGSSRIDMILLSGRFANNYTAHHAVRTIGSDHLCPVISTTSSSITTHGGHWQLPIWLSSEAANTIKPTLEKLASQTSHHAYPEIYSKAMQQITGQCQALHKRILRWRKDKIERARLRWVRAHLRAVASPTPELLDDAETTRQTWIKLVRDKQEMNRHREFDKHFEKAERCSAFFLRRPRAKRATIIPGVATANGSVSHDPEIIQTEHRQFWSNLYSRDANGSETAPTDEDIDALLPSVPTAITERVRDTLDRPLSEDDIVTQIQHLPTNKAAGADGLRAELFKQTPKLWAKVLYPILETQLHATERIPPSLRESIIILLHKKGSTFLTRNYRPIALLNISAKILSGIYNNRLRNILTDIVPPEQTGFIPRRSISENIILIQDAINYCKRHHPDAVILSLDFEKAYDRVQWRVMKAILTKLGFGPRWMTIIAAIYRDRSARLSINGKLSPTFEIQRGVFQGDPLSPALFILQCTPLYTDINNARADNAIPFPDGTTSPAASYYADDTNLISKSPECAVRLYDIAMRFCNRSGAKLHPDKCVAIPTGPAASHLPNGIRILGPSESTTILGIPMGLAATRTQQIEKVTTTMLEKCAKWFHVGRTVEGRVTIARSIILATIWYVLGVLPTREKEAKRIQQLINNYINRKDSFEWEGSQVRGNMSASWYYLPHKEGGWGLTQVLHSLRTRKLALIRSFMAEKKKGQQNHGILLSTKCSWNI